MDNIVIFSNPYSGYNFRDKSRLKSLQKIVRNNGIVYSTKSQESLEKRVSDLNKLNPKAIIVSGGDGTVASIVTTLMKYWPSNKELPAFGVIPSGTINILARECASLKSKKRMSRLVLRPLNYLKNIVKGEDALDYLRDIISMPEDDLFCKDVDFMKVHDNNNNLLYGFSAGMGLPVTLMQEYYKAKHLKLIKISSMLMHLVASAFVYGDYYRKFNYKETYSINGDTPEDYLGFMAQTLQSIGMPKSSPFYKAELSSGKFHALGIKADLGKFMRYTPAFYAGDSIPGTLDLQADNLIISSDSKFSYQVNGDLDFFGKKLEANILNIEQGVKLRILQPKNGH